MRRRISLLAAVLMCLTALLAACGSGTKDAESVVKDLDKVVSSMESYHGKGTMTLNTGQQPLQYDVDVTYQKPNYYRIELTNAKKDITQIVLRNDEGVFVLTPRLNKVFRFQSDWPQNQGQVYLYQTLVQSILIDNSRQFAIDKETYEKDSYVFDVMANYQNGSLARQKIWLDQDNYIPLKVQVSDTNQTVMVTVEFKEFAFDAKPDKSVFDTQRNLSGAANKPSTTEPADEGAADAQEQTDPAATENGSTNGEQQQGADNAGNAATGTDAEGSTEQPDAQAGEEPAEDTMAPADDSNAGVDLLSDALEPLYLPEGVAFEKTIDIEFGGLPGVIDRYSSEDYDFTILKTQPADVAASTIKGTMVPLGFTIAELTGGEESEQRTLTWTYNGIQYRLTSGTLPEAEMFKVAQSVQGEMTK
ncbi:outer membrane lipoprotein-sorting protein [Paenibacillus phyllosphaerae]|uniref:Outer membrane lipoprotein-sorting protein n=1 Tax=Paenibacillus phyllosphaerae TaxID=274593 RepID=A0A7W5B0D1_9BACL|nr:outer membrane lipoprotein carrier protein LolA [Paenibacillus phyllosphaerae]MBB3112099.1 outer membrane lipoprotein-sorting protein [Paenibacillus phyllosphaerae]